MRTKRLLLQALLTLSGLLCLVPFAWQALLSRRIRVAAETMQRSLRASHNPQEAVSHYFHDVFFLAMGGWLLGIVGAGLFVIFFFALRRLPKPEPLPPPLPPTLG